MTMPQDTYHDLMKRTIRNYEFVRDNAKQHGLYEVTQLVNSFIAVIGYPREHEIGTLLEDISIEEGRAYGLPDLPVLSTAPKYGIRHVGDQAAMLRHAVAHGRIRFDPEPDGKIIGTIRFSDRNRSGNQRHTSQLTIQTIEDVLYGFYKPRKGPARTGTAHGVRAHRVITTVGGLAPCRPMRSATASSGCRSTGSMRSR